MKFQGRWILGLLVMAFALARCDFQKKTPDAAENPQEIVRENPEALKPAPSQEEPEAYAPVIQRVPVPPEPQAESVPSAPPSVPPEQESGY